MGLFYRINCRSLVTTLQHSLQMWCKIATVLFQILAQVKDFLSFFVQLHFMTRVWLLASEAPVTETMADSAADSSQEKEPSASSVLTMSKEGKDLVISQPLLGTQTAGWEREEFSACYYWNFSSDLVLWGQKRR